MLGGFETRLAAVLGGRLDGDLQNQVFVGPDGAVEPRVELGIRHALPITEGLGPRPQRVVPGADDPRRVLCLRCEVELRFVFGNDSTRADARAAVDAVAFAIEAPDLIQALAGLPNPGFLVQQVGLTRVELPMDLEDQTPGRVIAHASGWFWPPLPPPPPVGGPILEVPVRIEELES